MGIATILIRIVPIITTAKILLISHYNLIIGSNLFLDLLGLCAFVEGE